MRFHSYRETEPHGTDYLPVDYYYVDERHPRYEMIHHWHKEYEFIFISSGWLELTLDGDSFFLKAGDTALVNPGVVHSAVPKAATYECILFNLDIGVKQNLSRYDEGRLILSGERILPVFITEKSEVVKKSATDLKNAMSNKKIGFELAALSSISAIFAEVIVNSLSVTATENSLKFAERIQPFENAVSLIEKSFSAPLTLEDLSSAAGMSKKYFGEYFKNMCGKCPTEFLNKYRIERASEMLMHTDLAVTEIAMECGFNDLSYFIKTFKRQKNTTPARYRKGI